MRLRNTVIALLCPIITLIAQQPIKKQLTIGDSVPEIYFSTVINHETPSVRLSDFKGKLVILDFWATWCGSCLHSFPKLDSLQTVFGSRLQVLLVNTKNTRDNEAKVRAFYEKWEQRTGRKLALPSVVEDTITDSYFEHHLLPHYAWINGQGTVVALTSAEEITEGNIRAILDGGFVNLAMKKDQDTNKPIFSSEDLPTEGLLNYVVFIKGNFNGLPSGERGRYKDESQNGIVMTNTSLLSMYNTVARRIHPEMNSHLFLLEVKDSSMVLLPPQAEDQRQQWYKENLYSFELVVPPDQSKQLFVRALESLNYYSGLCGKFEKREIECLILKLDRKTDKILTAGGKAENKLIEEDTLKKGTMNLLLRQLNNNPDIQRLVIDETGYKGKINIGFSVGLGSLETIQNQLKEYGLSLKKEKRLVEVFVLTKK